MSYSDKAGSRCFASFCVGLRLKFLFYFYLVNSTLITAIVVQKTVSFTLVKQFKAFKFLFGMQIIFGIGHNSSSKTQRKSPQYRGLDR